MTEAHIPSIIRTMLIIKNDDYCREFIYFSFSSFILFIVSRFPVYIYNY